MDTTSQNSQCALITGAAGGLGKAFAVECASRGWDVHLTDRFERPLTALASALERAYGIRAEISVCDLTDAAERREWLNRVHQSGRHFTMLINVAGVDHEGLFFEQSAEHIQTIIQLNIAATLDLTRALLPMREPQKPFRIINVSSLSAFYPMPVKAVYSASKRFLLNFSLALREELRSQDATVTVLCPAGMPTNTEVIRAIEAQGLGGELTTVDTGRVAFQTVNAALQGKAVVIPGILNQALRLAGILPAGLLARLIGRRWMNVHAERRLTGSLHPTIS
jgi:short-subunit dehydrogenase